MRHTVILAVCLAFFFAPRTLADLGGPFYLADSARQLLRADPNTGAVERVGRTNDQFTDIAFAPDGQLYGVTWADLYEINPATGTDTWIGAHGFGDLGYLYEINALAFSADGQLFAAGNDLLISINPQTGHGTALGGLSGYRSAGDLSFAADGRLLLTTDSGTLVEAHTDGSGATAVGSLPFNDIYAAGTDPDGVIWGVRASNEIVTINPLTGAANVVAALQADFPLGHVWGGGFPFYLPEPPTLLLCLAGGALVARARRSAHPARRP